MNTVMIANDWSAGYDNPTSKHRIAFELERRGGRVLWLSGAGMRQPRLQAGADRRRIVGRLAAGLRGPVVAPGHERIWTMSPLLLPLPSSAMARRFNGLLYRHLALRAAARLGFESPVLINYVPTLADAMHRWPGTAVYHCVDRWDAFEVYDTQLMAMLDARCCRLADIVIASSADLETRCRRHNPRVTRIDHGVDYAHFASALESGPRPADLPADPVIGFFGLLSEWLDQELIVKLAQTLPEASIVLIGTADVSVDRLRALPNVTLPGPRPFRELPRYIAHFDVGLIPFVVNDLTRAVNPIKLREMLAAGCPVVSTALPEVARYAGDKLPEDAVRTATTHREFIDFVTQRLAKPFTARQRRSLSETMTTETWERKVNEIVGRLKTLD